MGYRLFVASLCAALLLVVVPSALAVTSTVSDVAVGGESAMDVAASAAVEGDVGSELAAMATLPNETWVQLDCADMGVSAPSCTNGEIRYEEYAGTMSTHSGALTRTDPHEFVVTMRVYKLPDTNYEAKDWYLTELDVWTNANMDNGGEILNLGFWWGGWVYGRTVDFDLVGSPADVQIEEYSPEDVIGETGYASTVGYSIGGSITNTGGGISGSYSASKTTSYSIPDVSIGYTGSAIKPHSYWYENIAWDKPASTGELLTGYKVIWSDDPTDGTVGFDVNVHVQTAICSYYRSSNNSGWCNDALMYFPKPDPPWDEVTVPNLTRIEVLDFDRVVHVGGNLAPRAPELPSVQSPVTVGQSVPVTMVGSDRDGNPIEFAVDFGDGTPVVYGPAVPERGGAYAVDHAWSKPGTYGVRIHSRDTFGAESTWSPTFFVQVLPSDQKEAYALVDPTQGRWHFFEGDQESGSIYYGNPGDYPILGDWDGDGLETPGMYRQSDGYVYLRNSLSQGTADLRFFFGDPGDIPLAGDFNGDGYDTVSIYRPSEGRVFIINELGKDEGGLGAAEYAYYFGDPGDKPFVGDFDADGVETIGLHRESTGLVYFRNSHTQGIADSQFIYGDPGDRIVAHDWNTNGQDTPALFRPSNTTMYFRYTNTQGVADSQWTAGSANWVPIAGAMGLD